VKASLLHTSVLPVLAKIEKIGTRNRPEKEKKKREKSQHTSVSSIKASGLLAKYNG
jgi:hypothetical protein